MPVVTYAIRVRLRLLGDCACAGDGVGGLGRRDLCVLAVAEAGHEAWFAGARGGGGGVACARHCVKLCFLRVSFFEVAKW